MNSPESIKPNKHEALPAIEDAANFTPDFGTAANKVELPDGEFAQLVDSVEVPANISEQEGTLSAIRKKYVENNPLLGRALAFAIAANGLMPHKVESAQELGESIDVKDVLGADGKLPDGTYDISVDSDTISITLKPDALGVKAADVPFVEVVVPAKSERVTTFDTAAWAGVHGERPAELLTDEDFMKYRADLRVKWLLEGMYANDLTPNEVIISIEDGDPSKPGFVGRASAEGPERINIPAAEARGAKGMEFYVDAFTSGHGVDAEKIHLTSGGSSSEGAPTVESFQADLESRGIEVRNITKIIQDCNRGNETNPEVLAAFDEFAKGRGVAIDFVIKTKEVHVFSPVLDTSQDITMQEYAIVRDQKTETGETPIETNRLAEGNYQSEHLQDGNRLASGNYTGENTEGTNRVPGGSSSSSQDVLPANRETRRRLNPRKGNTLSPFGRRLSDAWKWVRQSLGRFNEAPTPTDRRGLPEVEVPPVNVPPADVPPVDVPPISVPPVEVPPISEPPIGDPEPPIDPPVDPTPPRRRGLRLRQMRYIPGNDTLPNAPAEPNAPNSRDVKQQQKAVGLSNASKSGLGGNAAIKGREKADSRRRPPTKKAGSGRRD